MIRKLLCKFGYHNWSSIGRGWVRLAEDVTLEHTGRICKDCLQIEDRPEKAHPSEDAWNRPPSKRVSVSNIYKGKPLKWDRPNEGLYEDGAIRIYTKNDAGEFTMARMATDEEVRFIMMYELLAGSVNSIDQIKHSVETVEHRVLDIRS